MKKTALSVFARERVSGRLTRSELEADTFLFNYTEGCRSTDAVSITMPVRPDQ